MLSPAAVRIRLIIDGFVSGSSRCRVCDVQATSSALALSRASELLLVRGSSSRQIARKLQQQQQWQRRRRAWRLSSAAVDKSINPDGAAAARTITPAATDAGRIRFVGSCLRHYLLLSAVDPAGV